ncbi:MAG TPA: chemotaxis protein CheW [Aggregicoccus sp.]|nr:chemotaxis protein CheW [Aggregicoccus sp.]
MRHVIFRVEKERYGLPLAAVREVVVPPERFTRVPRAPPALRGVMNLRGRVVTVVELGPLLGLPEGATPPARVVLLDRGRRDLGLLVTEVEGVESIERVSTAPGKAAPAVRGVARVKGQAVTVLDPEGLDGAVVGLFAPQK